MGLREAIDNFTGSSELAGRERIPWDEADLVGGAMCQHILAVSLDEVVAVLHRHDRKYPSGRLDVFHRDLAQSGVADDAFIEKLTHRAELFVARHLRIDAMKLPEIDMLNAESFETALGLSDEIGGTSVGRPLVRPWTRESGFSRDQQSFIGMKRLANQFLRHIGAVAVGSVDKIDADLRQSAQCGKRRGAIPGWPPDTLARDPHGAVAEPVDREVSNPELAGSARVDRCRGLCLGAHGYDFCVM